MCVGTGQQLVLESGSNAFPHRRHRRRRHVYLQLESSPDRRCHQDPGMGGNDAAAQARKVRLEAAEAAAAQAAQAAQAAAAAAKAVVEAVAALRAEIDDKEEAEDEESGGSQQPGNRHRRPSPSPPR